jgi:hypothetical protein
MRRSENPKQKEQLRYLKENGKRILKWIIKKQIMQWILLAQDREQ